jgi:hypothetical protein
METIKEGVDLACGLMIDIASSEQEIKQALMTPAKRTVEVMVKARGKTKEFTFADFLSRLGFQ